MGEFVAHNIWSVPIYQNLISVKTEWTKFCEVAECKRTNDNNGWISTNFNILDATELQDLKIQILDNVGVYLNHHLEIKNKMRLTTSWITKHDKGDQAQIHSHQNSIISGVYYLKTAENCGDLYFNRGIGRESFLSETFHFDRIRETTINGNRHRIEVNEGMLLLFPSTVKHGTAVMRTDNFQRIAISFNMFLHGSIGGDDLYLEA